MLAVSLVAVTLDITAPAVSENVNDVAEIEKSLRYVSIVVATPSCKNFMILPYYEIV